jgi:hypothetical protein
MPCLLLLLLLLLLLHSLPRVMPLLATRRMMTRGVVFARTPPSPLARSSAVLRVLEPLVLVVVLLLLQLLLLLLLYFLPLLLRLLFLFCLHHVSAEMKTPKTKRTVPPRQEGCGQTSRASGSRMGHRLLPAAHVAPPAPAPVVAARLLLLLHLPPPDEAASCCSAGSGVGAEEEEEEKEEEAKEQEG